jgi:hypothetical protein
MTTSNGMDMNDIAPQHATIDGISLRVFSCYRVRDGREEGFAMKAFLIACLAVIVVAAIGVVALNSVQQAADQAFTSPYARLGT